MNTVRIAFLTCLALGLAGCGKSDSTKSTTTPAKQGEPAKVATNKEKIVGVWDATKSASELPPGAMIEFTKDGKIKLSAKIPDGKMMTIDGTYTVEGDKLMTSMKPPGGKEEKETMTITKLTDTELVTKDNKGKIDEFKKKK